MTEQEIQDAVVGVCKLRGVPIRPRDSKSSAEAYWQTQRLMRDLESKLAEAGEADLFGVELTRPSECSSKYRGKPSEAQKVSFAGNKLV